MVVRRPDPRRRDFGAAGEHLESENLTLFEQGWRTSLDVAESDEVTRVAVGLGSRRAAGLLRSGKSKR